MCQTDSWDLPDNNNIDKYNKTIISISKNLLGAIKKYDWKALGQNFSSRVPWLVGAQTFMKRGKVGLK